MLHVISATYKEDYKITVCFDDDTEITADFKKNIFSDSRKIVQELKDLSFFKDFSISADTITWKNGLDFAPEFIKSLG